MTLTFFIHSVVMSFANQLTRDGAGDVFPKFQRCKVEQEPTEADDVATKAYVDAGGGGGTPNLNAVLTEGNDAGGVNIINVGQVQTSTCAISSSMTAPAGTITNLTSNNISTETFARAVYNSGDITTPISPLPFPPGHGIYYFTINRAPTDFNEINLPTMALGEKIIMLGKPGGSGFLKVFHPEDTTRSSSSVDVGPGESLEFWNVDVENNLMFRKLTSSSPSGSITISLLPAPP